MIIWDPYGSIGYGPMDEYYYISDEILRILEKYNFSVTNLTDFIKNIDPTNDTAKEKIDVIISLLLELKNTND